MSQGGSFNDNSALPDVETITADSGGAVGPDAAFNIDILGGTNVTTVGNPGTNTITINTSGGQEGTGQTIGAVNDDIITFALGAAAGCYTFHAKLVGFEATGPSGAGYEITAVVRTTGAAGALIGVPVINAIEDAAIVAAVGTMVVVGNDAIIRVTGVAALTINWVAELDSVSYTV